jgi:hypothetical protein
LFLFSSCRVIKNDIGKYEWEFRKEHFKNGYYQNINYGKPFKYYVLNGSHFRIDNEIKWKERQLYLYDYYYTKALEKNKNPDWYVSLKISEGESNTTE